SNGPIIASAGDRTVDWKLLERSFELNPQWKKDLTYQQAYLRQLDYLINEKLFAQAAQESGLLKDPKLVGYLKFIEEKELVKELYRLEVASLVEISEREYQEAYQKLKKQVKFDYIRSSSPERAEKYAAELKLRPLDEIQLLAPEEDSKGTTLLIAFGELRPELEDKVFSLQQGEISAPIPIDEGYMVVKVVDGRTDLFMSELDFAEKKNKIQKVVFDRKAGVVSNAYIKELMSDKNLTLNPEVFYALSLEFSKVIKNKLSDEPLPIFLSDAELAQTRHDLIDLLPQTLITFRDGEMTVGEFLQELSYMPPDLRPNLKMAPQLKDAIGVIVRNKYLAKEARKKNLDKNEQVKWEVQVQSDEILARYWLQQKSEQFTVTPEEILLFKQSENYQKYQRMKNDEPADELLQNLLLKQKISQQKILLADSLKLKYDVKIETARLTTKLKNADEIIDHNPIPLIVRELYY
ncbi:MAG: hypothetical protein A2Y94_14275, partial [Caldithrix sp. RBG_13_44_9]